MRRLWSYIILAGTSLVLMGSTFANVFKNSTSNIEYSDGRELVFRISEKDESELIEKTDSGETPAQIVSKTMIERLDSMKVTNYEVATESYDTVKVTLKQETDENYGNIQTLMTFDGSLALSSKKNDFRVNSDESEKFITGKAYMETKNNYPTVNIPVGDHFKEIYDIVKQYKEDDDTSAAESQPPVKVKKQKLHIHTIYICGMTTKMVILMNKPKAVTKITILVLPIKSS